MKGNDWPGMIMLMGFVILFQGILNPIGQFALGLLMICYGFCILERDGEESPKV